MSGHVDGHLHLVCLPGARGVQLDLPPQQELQVKADQHYRQGGPNPLASHLLGVQSLVLAVFIGSDS